MIDLGVLIGIMRQVYKDYLDANDFVYHECMDAQSRFGNELNDIDLLDLDSLWDLLDVADRVSSYLQRHYPDDTELWSITNEVLDLTYKIRESLIEARAKDP